MNNLGKTYANGQKITEQDGDTLTYFFEDGTIKSKGGYINGAMRGRWIFNKKEGYLWQVGYFDDQGKQHGPWIIFNQDGSIQKEKSFDHGKLVK
ncbi:MAG TPA: hypothetical protein VD907_01870 [Verrucomicrobiae bacterium]|nr:hypothetical protein [Verrucomicrobiae bacterium]